MSFLFSTSNPQEENMVKAEITVGTCYGDAIIPVEVVRYGPRPGTVWVQALGGLNPFTRMSHGGPYQDSMAIVLIPNLRDVHVEEDGKAPPEEKELQGVEIEIQSSPEAQPLLPDWFLESVYTLCAQPPEGGEA
jgi:hypothetical protein